MLKRAWLLFAVLWGALIMWLASYEEHIATMTYVIAFGPFFVPWVLRTFFGFVRRGADYFRLRKVRKP